MLWRDRLIGVVLGVVLGIGVIVVFVFVFSEQTVDAPSLSEEPRGAHPRDQGSAGGGRGNPPVATVRVIGGAPPSSGPAELDYRKGDLVRLRVVSDAAIDVELPGYGVDRTVPANRPTIVSFVASKPGSFPLLIAASHIDVARITIDGAAL